MATRSRIGIQLADQSVLSVYHHWDGYPEWLGRILNTHYNTKEKVSELIDGGDMSSCWSDRIWDKELPKGEYAPEYYSARGEDCPPRYDSNLASYAKKECGEEFHYVFRKVGGDYQWICIDMHSFDDKKPETVSIPDTPLAV
tara:strand:- start:1794 stop:2219 length:426 start_codon:yes stop_codon:yes gene_type:complete